MEKVLDRTAVSSGCTIKKNDLGLYDLEITDDRGRIVEVVKNVTFHRAVVMIEDSMYANRRASHD